MDAPAPRSRGEPALDEAFKRLAERGRPPPHPRHAFDQLRELT